MNIECLNVQVLYKQEVIGILDHGLGSLNIRISFLKNIVEFLSEKRFFYNDISNYSRNKIK